MQAFLAESFPSPGSPSDRPDAGGRAGEVAPATSRISTQPIPRRARPRERWPHELARWLVAALGFSILIVLHELATSPSRSGGHARREFLAVLPAAIWSKKRGETSTRSARSRRRLRAHQRHEPVRGPPGGRARPRYHAQPLWKRMAVIAAGPALNIVLAFILLFVFFAAWAPQAATRVGDRGHHREGLPRRHCSSPATSSWPSTARPDRRAELPQAIASHECAGRPRDGCKAATPVRLVVERDGETKTIQLLGRSMTHRPSARGSGSPTSMTGRAIRTASATPFPRRATGSGS